MAQRQQSASERKSEACKSDNLMLKEVRNVKHRYISAGWIIAAALFILEVLPVGVLAVNPEMNEFSVKRIQGEEENYVPPYGSITLEVKGHANHEELMKYQWYHWTRAVDDTGCVYHPGYKKLENETRPSITVEKVNEYDSYYCCVDDGYGNSEDVYFYLHVENHLSLERIKGKAHDSVVSGESISLEVRAKGDDLSKISYQWYRRVNKPDGHGNDSSFEDFPGETGISFTSDPILEDVEIWCRAEDGFDNREDVSFYIQVKDLPVTCASGHAWDEGRVSKEPSCTQQGTRTYKCSRCGEEKTESIEKKAHTPVSIPGRAATCAETGLTEGSKCSVCGEILKVQTETAKLTEHTWDNGVVTVSPTLKKKGIRTYTCTVCGTTRTEEISNKDLIDKAERKDKNSLKNVEKSIAALKDKEDLKGSSFAPLKVRAAAKSSSVSLAWTEVAGAKGYVIYGSPCGAGNRMVKLGSVKKPRFTLKKLNKKVLKPGTYYKFVVVAYQNKNGYNSCITASKTIYACTTGGKVTNPKKVSVNAAGIGMKVKAKYKIHTQLIPANKKLILKEYRPLCFESANKKIATVNSKGEVTGKKKGKTTIYVYAQNGVFATVKITVK